MTDQPSSVTREQTLAERYGARSRGRSPAIVALVAVVAAALLAWLVWAAWFHSTPEVTGRLTSFSVVSPHRVDVVLEIRRDGTDPAECTVTARAEDHAVVGEHLVRLDGGQAGTHRVTATVRTDREATTATVADCR